MSRKNFPVRIAIIGTGNVGQALDAQLSKHHDVLFGSRKPSGERQYTYDKACERGEVIILAVPFPFLDDAIGLCANVDGKIILDATNPIREDFSGLSLPEEGSAGERVQALAPKASVAKCFNTIGADVMRDPSAVGKPVIPICGNDDAVDIATTLAKDIGFEPLNCGGLTMARHVESWAWIWIQLAQGGQGREFGFELTRA